MNRLGAELSPYLLEHAENPVDWFPWGPEALARAKELDRPILVSIGYSACHWCHVMARESFSNAAIARQMNAGFVCVKIDREERPDLDQIHQLVVQRMGRTGGWPLTVFLTPDRKPFFGGTYFPDVPKYGMPSFPEVLSAVMESFRERRADIEAGADEVLAEIASLAAAPKGRAEGDLPPNAVVIAAGRLARRFDEKNGGFGDRPKFPSTLSLDVLLRAAHAGDAPSLRRAVTALDAMAAGGIHDQLGGGFHRYSTDARWLVPHFEKMLYDNALLLRTYADAYAATGGEHHAAVCERIVAWAEREMSSPEGTFFSSQDADSEGEEGRFFVWRPSELDVLLEPDDARFAKIAFGVSEAGNFENTGASVLSRSRPIELVARELGLAPDAARATLERTRSTLLQAREQRPRPLRDEKVLATWNGLFIGALAHAGAALGRRAWIERARRALGVFAAEIAGGAPLARLRKDGVRKGVSFLDDHADLACAALDVFEAADDPLALALARELVERALDGFWDEHEGAFDLAPREVTDLCARPRDAFDHATPSGAAAMTHALLRLGSLVDEPRFERIADVVLRSLGPGALEHPAGYSHLCCALDRAARGAVEIVVVARAGDPEGAALLEVARRAWCPNRVLARVEPGSREGLARRLPGGVSARAAAFVCRHRTCEPPVGDPAELARKLAPEREGAA